MAWIGNYSKTAVHEGLHFANNENNSVLIQISDCDSYPLEPARTFTEVHRFWFDDVEDESDKNSVNNKQIEQIAQVLKKAYEKNQDVVVNCHAGLCRSGAITEVGIMLGFKDAETKRIPNLFVKNKLATYLGLSFNPYKSVFYELDSIDNPQNTR